MNGVQVRHNFETAHRLPHLGGKCENLHGHSWWVTVNAEAPELAPDGTVVEFGEFKAKLRTWIDHTLDHGVMLGAADPLVPVLTDAGKVLVFGAKDATIAADLRWPTVENVAVLLARVATVMLHECIRATDAEVTSVVVRETHVNAATWRP